MRITVSHNLPDVARKIETLGQDIAGKAMRSALNKTIAIAKTAMSKEIRSEFMISKAEVDDSLKINKAIASGGRFALWAALESRTKRGRSLNMIHFMEKYVSLAQAKKRKKAETLNRLFVQIKRGGGRKSLGKSFIGNKGRTVFVRTGGAKTRVTKGSNAGKMKEPIKAMQTIGVPSMFNTRRVNAVVTQIIKDKFPSIFAHEAEFFIKRFNDGR